MERLEPKIEELKIKNLYQFLDFLEGEFGENVTKKLFKPPLEHRAQADRVLGHGAEKVQVERLKKAEVTPITVAQLNHIIDLRSKSLETDLRQIDLRHSEKFEKNIKEEKEEKEKMLRAMKDKEIVMDGEGNVEVKIKS